MDQLGNLGIRLQLDVQIFVDAISEYSDICANNNTLGVIGYVHNVDAL